MKATNKNISALKRAGFFPEDKAFPFDNFWELTPGGWGFLFSAQRTLKTLCKRLKTDAVGRDGNGWSPETRRAYKILRKITDKS
jgi:hypothetical protein